MKTFKNPIISGFHPDPSICRVGEDYYLITSTFEFFPGLPIYHSRDLVHWECIGHALDRPSQLNLDHLPSSAGLFAPTIRYHDGTFYIVNTLVMEWRERMVPRNFIVTTTDPAGDWSEPYWLDDAPGIDPSLFFDDDGRAWYVGNRTSTTIDEPSEVDKEIWLQELDLNTMQLIGDTYLLWDGAMKHAVHPEAPHIYKIYGRYYLLIAEGGTSLGHSITIAVSDDITGSYQPYEHNPIMTHRHLPKNYPITSTGHADLIETQHGDWYIVMLATRPYGGEPDYNLGRETFLAPVTWEEVWGTMWPRISPETGKVELEYSFPNLPLHHVPELPTTDQFDTDKLSTIWNFLRTPREIFWHIEDSYLRLDLRPEVITDLSNPSFIGRRQQHINFAVRTVMDFTPKNENEHAGLVLLQNEDYQFRFVVHMADGQRVAQVIRRDTGTDTIVGQLAVSSDSLFMKIVAYGQDYSFYIAEKAEQWQVVAMNQDGRILSSSRATGFIGAYIGMYASSRGQSSNNQASFDWFEYQSITRLIEAHYLKPTLKIYELQGASQ